jgi:hypothetical protein
MIAEGATKKLVVPRKGLLRRPKSEVGKLFTTMANDSGTEDPFKSAQEKIKRVRDLVHSLRERYPKKRFPMRNRIFDELEASCEKAEERMQRVQDRHLRSMGMAS